MAARRPGVTVGAVDAAPLHTLLLVEIATGRQTLAGTVRTVDGPAMRFCGWLELAAAIERVRLRAEDVAKEEPLRAEGA